MMGIDELLREIKDDDRQKQKSRGNVHPKDEWIYIHPVTFIVQTESSMNLTRP